MYGIIRMTKLLFSVELTFISRRIPIKAKGSANYESPCTAALYTQSLPSLSTIQYHQTRKQSEILMFVQLVYCVIQYVNRERMTMPVRVLC